MLTEPDEKHYLVLDHNPGGPTAGFDYGRHFLFQGHENGGAARLRDAHQPRRPRGSPHRITLLTPVNPATTRPASARSTAARFNPFTKTLLFTQEAGTGGAAVIQLTLEWPVRSTRWHAFLARRL